MSNNLIFELYKKPQTVFSLKEISLIFPEIPYINLKRQVNYYINVNKLKRLRRGIYAKDNFNSLELANKLYTPSYISLETVLQKSGMIFQVYKTIFVVSYLTRKINVGDVEIFFRKIKNDTLYNKLGIEEEDGFFIASKERAFLDAVFLYKNYHFDNLKPLNWEKVFEIQLIYKSKALEKRVKEYYQILKKENV